MQQAQEDGSSYRDHLLAGWRQQGYREEIKPEELKFGDIPSEAVRAWNAFFALSLRRDYDEAGPKRLSFLELKAYLESFKIELEQWELDTILKLDDAFIKVWLESRR